MISSGKMLDMPLRNLKTSDIKNKIPSFTYEGKTRIKIDISITKAKHIYVNWRK